MSRSVRVSCALTLLLTGALARAQAAAPQISPEVSSEASDTSAGLPDTGTPVDVPAPVAEGGPATSSFQTTVEASAPTPTASAVTIRDQDLRVRTPATPEDILRVVPGLVIAQHQGGGKADQLFLRGFDADHGTDVALFIDGVPINLPSHAHGQGYADLHFLIPETLKLVDVFKDESPAPPPAKPEPAPADQGQ